MSAYPTTIPVASVQTIVTLLKERTVKENVQEFAKAIWEVQGYAQLMLIGEPGATTYFGQGISEEEQVLFTEMATELEAYGCGPDCDCKTTEIVDLPGADAKAIPWALIIQAIPMIIEMLKQLGILKEKPDATE